MCKASMRIRPSAYSCIYLSSLRVFLRMKVIAANGRVRLATFDIDRDDEHKTMAARLGVQR